MRGLGTQQKLFFWPIRSSGVEQQRSVSSRTVLIPGRGLCWSGSFRNSGFWQTKLAWVQRQQLMMCVANMAG
ncbi:hypothetical protein WJX74_008680 [Apatococcus lobatus]|uniref:Uncharacterized protein n=1 Tax=Apatococcus lobatus TaxID=904363 RepID=A0AAW1QUK2_9CHLO